jgi:hypothetical protein
MERYMNMRFDVLWLAKDAMWRVSRDDGHYIDVRTADHIPGAMRRLAWDVPHTMWGEALPTPGTTPSKFGT